MLCTIGTNLLMRLDIDANMEDKGVAVVQKVMFKE
jgi:hypothetical protein